MKKTFLICILCSVFCALSAQTDSTEVKKDSVEGWQFTTVDSVPITRVKDQHRSGTCWAFSTLGFLESEVLRIKGKVCGQQDPH